MSLTYQSKFVLYFLVAIIIGLATYLQFKQSALADSPLEKAGYASQFARPGDFAVSARNASDTSNHDKLFAYFLRVGFGVPHYENYRFLNSVGQSPSTSGNYTNWRIGLVDSATTCSAYISANKTKSASFRPSAFFNTSNTFKLKNLTINAVNHDFPLNQKPNTSVPTRHVFNSRFTRNGVTIRHGQVPCLEVIYRDGNRTVYEYMPGDAIQTQAAFYRVSSIQVIRPNNRRPVQLGEQIILRVNFNRDVHVSPNRAVTNPQQRPYFRVQSNQAGYANDWIFQLKSYPLENNTPVWKRTLDFVRTVELGDEIISNTSSATYQFNKAKLIEGNNIRLHFGDYHIISSRGGFLPERTLLKEKASRTATAEQNLGTNVRTTTSTPDYYVNLSTRAVDDFNFPINTKPSLEFASSAVTGRTLTATIQPTNTAGNNPAIAANSWYVRVSSSRTRPIGLCSTNTGSRYTGGTVSVSGNRASAQLPQQTSNRWYCLGGTDSSSARRPVGSAWVFHGATASDDSPSLNFSVTNNRLTMTYAAKGSNRIATNGFGWFRMATADTACTTASASKFTNTSPTITITAATAPSWICVRVADNAGNTNVQRYQLLFSRVISSPEHGDDFCGHPTIINEHCNVLPPNWSKQTTAAKITYWKENSNLRNYWAALTPGQKITLNPFGCKPSAIRADNGRCTDGSEGTQPSGTVRIGDVPDGDTDESADDEDETTETEEEEAEEDADESADDEDEAEAEEDADEEDETVETVETEVNTPTEVTTPEATTPTQTTDASSSSSTSLMIAIVGGILLAGIIVAILSTRK